MANITVHGITSLTVDVSETRREGGSAYRCITFVSRDADGREERVRFFTQSLDLELDGLSLNAEVVEY
tara:strand:+ start:78 stop:281 length:204 start_codon:yes stop_codon:yes gene_type:complete